MFILNICKSEICIYVRFRVRVRVSLFVRTCRQTIRHVDGRSIKHYPIQYDIYKLSKLIYNDSKYRIFFRCPPASPRQ